MPDTGAHTAAYISHCETCQELIKTLSKANGIPLEDAYDLYRKDWH